MKPKLLYICGMGHSGSTIIDLALSSCPGVVSVAQLNELYTQYDPEDGGENTGAIDAFWRDVLAELTETERHQLKAAHESVNQERNLLSMLTSQTARKTFADHATRVLQVIVDKTDARLVVDSSKNISRCIGLTASDSVDVYVLHLIRDVRGLVNSANKRKSEIKQSQQYVRPTFHWASKNVSASLLVPWYAKKLIKLRYEDFVHHPRETVAKLSDFLGENLDEALQAFLGETEIDPNTSLGFGGNRVLHQRKKLRFRTGESPKGGVFESNVYWYTLGWIASFWGYRRVLGRD